MSLELGPNTLVAAARGANGNSATHSVDVNRGGAGPALVLPFRPISTSPIVRGSTSPEACSVPDRPSP